MEPDSGEIVHSFSMLTVNADCHPVMGRFHRPGDEKRSVVVLDETQFEAWLRATTEQALEMCRQPGDDLLITQADPRPEPTTRTGTDRQAVNLGFDF